MPWETVIGLEVHIQLNTQSKIFSSAPATFGATPNSCACAIDLGLPGVLPVVNKQAIYMAIKFGIAIAAKINKKSIFARKHYFYPDLPKGYQISQHHFPIIGPGKLAITLDNGDQRNINILQAHLEEDAGKSLHEDFHGMTGIDLNRAGVPLLEIVSAPEISCTKEAIAYLKALHTLVCYLGICDGNMQEGSFRCDANISVRRQGNNSLGTRTEIKNMNSFRAIERALRYEQARHIDILENGGHISQQTRLFDANTNQTHAMRSKEAVHDYRYFPDPDLLPLVIDDKLIEKIKQSLPELPQQKRQRFQKDYGLSAYDASVLTSQSGLANYFETAVKQSTSDPKLVCNWINSELLGALNKANLSIDQSPVSALQLAQLLKRISDNTISGKIAKEIFVNMWQGQGSADEIIKAKGLKQITDNITIEKMVDQIIANNQNQVQQYRSGKDKLLGYFVGQVMAATKGKANPKQVNDILKQKLTS